MELPSRLLRETVSGYESSQLVLQPSTGGTVVSNSRCRRHVPIQGGSRNINSQGGSVAWGKRNICTPDVLQTDRPDGSYMYNIHVSNGTSSRIQSVTSKEHSRRKWGIQSCNLDPISMELTCSTDVQDLHTHKVGRIINSLLPCSNMQRDCKYPQSPLY